MASNDKSEGPQVGQMVLYNNAGTITPAIIYGIAAAGTVNLLYFTSGGATNANAVKYDGTQANATTWSYMPFF